MSQETKKSTISAILQKHFFATTALAVAGALSATTAQAAVGDTPTGGNVVGGTATIGYSNQSRNMVVTQTNTNRTVIDWTTFNINTNAQAEFKQLNNNSMTVNRVVGPQTNPSQILGTLKSTVNGQVGGRIMILDKNGVLFGTNARIDVGGLIAATGNLADQAGFLAGGEDIGFTDTDTNPDAKIINNATKGTFNNNGINIAEGGLLAFVAPYVENNGTINAKAGIVALAAGKRATLDFTGDDLISVTVEGELDKAIVENKKNIDAQGGTVMLTAGAAKTALDSVVNMSGVIKANSFGVKNGKIVLSSRGKTTVSGTLDASRTTTEGTAATSAGEVRVEGVNVEITSTAKINTSISGVMGGFLNLFNQGGTGNAGNVYIWGDESVVYAGKIEARGGSKGGNGGQVGISAANTVAYRGTVDASAANGTRGTLTIDPSIVTIGNSMFDPVVNAASLAETLGLTNVHIIAGDKIVLVDEADLSHWGLGGLSVTAGDLHLQAPTIDLLKDLTMGSGDLTVEANVVNLGGKLLRNIVPFVNVDLFNSLLGRDDLTGYAHVVNVLGDTASVQQGIDLVRDNGAIVNVAWGNYQENINIYKNNLALLGDGSMPLLFGTDALGQVILVTANNVTVSGFTIDGVHAPWYLPHLYGIAAENVSGLDIVNNSFGNFLGAGVKLTNTENSYVGNNTFNLTATAIDIAGGSNHGVENNTITTTGTGIHLANVSYTRVSGNSVTGSIQNAIEAAGFDYSSIVDNIILGAGLNGIFVDGGNGVTVSGNNVGGAVLGDSINVSDVNGLTLTENIAGVSGDDAIELTNVSNASVSLNAAGLATDNALELNNTSDTNVFLNALGASEGDAVHVNGGYNIGIGLNLIGLTGDDGVEVNGASNVTVAGNLITGAGDNGVEVINSTNTNVLLNAILASGNNGVFVDPSTGMVAGNFITGSGANGVQVLDSNGYHVIGNIIQNSGANGVLVQNSNGVLVTLNQISGSGNDGIQAAGSDLNLIVGNNVSDSGANGINVTNALGTLVALNDVSESGNDGVKITNGDLSVVIANKVRSSGGDGIDVENAAGTLVTLNDVAGSTGNGIEISDALAAVVLDNDVEGSGLDGIRVTNAALAYVGQNHVENSGADGVALYNSLGAWVNENCIVASGDDGVDVHTSAGVLVTNNDITGSDDDGIDLDNSALALISGNDVSRSGDNGIEVSGSLLAGVTGNDVSRSRNDGINVTNSLGVKVKGNKVKYSGNDGIDVDSSAFAKIDDNDVYASGENGIEVSNSGFVSIEDNDVNESDENGISVANGLFVNIEDNDVDNSGNNGIHVNGGWVVDIHGNKVDDSENDGIDADGVRNLDIGYNRVTDSDGNGIEVTDSSLVDITRNYVDNSDENGIFVADSYNVDVFGNNVNDSGSYSRRYGATGDGIHVENTDKLDIAFNRVDNSKDDGIDVSFSYSEGPFAAARFGYSRNNVSILGNNVDDSGDNGIQTRNVNNLLIALNNIEDSDNDGIQVNGGRNVDVKFNKVDESGSDGIDVDDVTYTRIVGNNVDESGANGIEATNARSLDIGYNRVDDSYDNGVFVGDSKYVDIKGNKVSDSGHAETTWYGYGDWYYSSTEYVGDGIHVEGSRNVDIVNNDIENSTDDGIDVTGQYEGDEEEMQYARLSERRRERPDNIRIVGNNVDESGDNGIEVDNVWNLKVKHNRVDDSQNNGIVVEDVKDVTIARNRVRDSFDGDGIAVFDGENVDIRNNRVRNSGNNGILASGVEDLSITGNKVRNGNNTGIVVYDTPFAYVGDNKVKGFYNGIGVYFNYGVDIVGNTVSNIENDGIQVGQYPWWFGNDVFDIDITGNTISDFGQDGIQVAYADDILISGNTILGNPFSTGIRLGEGGGYKGCGEADRCEQPKFAIAEVSFGSNPFSGVSNVDIIGNTVTGNAVGLDARALNNGYINIAGNTFTDNDIGAWIASGLIDLTGASNRFTGGSIALRFDPGAPFGEGPGDDQPTLDRVVTLDIEGPLYQPTGLSLVDDTIGTTIFEGQSEYYIELLNGAFFDPGRPTIIDGRFATYDGFTPGTGPISLARLRAIEAMINDYDDDKTVGQIFTGFSLLGFDDNDIMRKVMAYIFKSGKGGIIVTGLPNTGGQGGQNGFSLQDLANLAPAAGGEDDGELTLEDLANLAPAAGGEGGEGQNGCWNNVGQGSVNVDLTDDLSAILAQEEACGG